MRINCIVQSLFFHFLIFACSFSHENSYSLDELFVNSQSIFDHNQKNITKNWTLVIFIAGDNNLSSYIAQNIEQILRIGSNNYINILVRIDTKLSNEEKVTKFLYVEKGALIQISPDSIMDSGNPDDLITFFKFVHERYPAEQWGLILWDHGIGYIDDAQLIGVDNYEQWNQYNRGICFDDSTLHYLTNSKLAYALDSICKMIGKKLELLGCDACFMNMWEFFKLMRHYIGVAVGSQELEPGTGWDYYSALKDFNHRSLSPHELAQNIVQAYGDLYEGKRENYTQAAINLENFDEVTIAMKNFAQELYGALFQDHAQEFYKIIKRCREKELSTIFDEPSYIDLRSFCLQIIEQIKQYKKKLTVFQKIVDVANGVIESIDKVVIANKTAQAIKAYGISIYFPADVINFSYYENSCPVQDVWIKFLELYHRFS